MIRRKIAGYQDVVRFEAEKQYGKDSSYLRIVVTSTNEISSFVVPLQTMCSGEHVQGRDNHRSAPMIRSAVPSHANAGLRKSR